MTTPINHPGNNEPSSQTSTPVHETSSASKPYNQQQEPSMHTDMSVTGARENTNATAQPIRVMIYRGANSSENCPESVAALFKSTFPNVTITYAGPDEQVKITAETLSQVDVFAQPGGPDLDDAMAEARPYAPFLRSFVSSGGRYIGFCLGGYMAGHDPGFSLLPPSDDVSQEISAPNAQVTTEDDAIIQVDWKSSTGKKAGKTEAKRWAYFQDGPMFSVGEWLGSGARVLARYSSSGDVAAVVGRFGEGWVAGVGPHLEADRDWYDDEDLTNPEGVRFDIGHDFLRAAMGAEC